MAFPENLVELSSITPQILVQEILEQTKTCALVWNAVAPTQFHVSVRINNRGYELYLSKIRTGSSIAYNLDILSDANRRLYFTNSDLQPDLIEVYRIIDRTMNLDTPGNRMREFLGVFATPHCVPVNDPINITIDLGDQGVLGEGQATEGISTTVSPTVSGGALGEGQAFVGHGTIDVGSGGILALGAAKITDEDVVGGGTAIVTSTTSVIGSGGIMHAGLAIVDQPMGGVGGGTALVTEGPGLLSIFLTADLLNEGTNQIDRLANRTLAPVIDEGALGYFYPHQYLFGTFCVDPLELNVFAVEVVSPDTGLLKYNIIRCDFDGRNREIILTFDTANPMSGFGVVPTYMDVDAANRKLYFLQVLSNTAYLLCRCNYDGSQLEKLGSINIRYFIVPNSGQYNSAAVTGLAIDPANSVVYWAEWLENDLDQLGNIILGNQTFIGRANLEDCSNQFYIYSNPTGFNQGFGLDRVNQKIYFGFVSAPGSRFAGQATPTGFYRVDLTGGVAIYSGDRTTNAAIDNLKNKVYFSTLSGIKQMDLNGQNVVSVSSQATNYLQIAYAPTILADVQATLPLYLLTSPFDPGAPQAGPCTTAYKLNSDNTANLFMNVAPASLPDNPGAASGAPDVCHFEVYNGKIYFVSYGDVYSANIDGTNIVHLTTLGNWLNLPAAFTTNQGYINGPGVTIDPVNGKIYIVNNSLWRCNLDGSQTEQIAPNTLGQPGYRIVADPDHDRIYWTQANWVTGGVYQASMDGTSPIKLYSSGLVCGLDIDQTNGKIYFTDHVRVATRTATLNRMNLDGSGLETVYSKFTSPVDIKLDVPNNKIYVADRRLYKLDLLTNDILEMFVEDAQSPSNTLNIFCVSG